MDKGEEEEGERKRRRSKEERKSKGVEGEKGLPPYESGTSLTAARNRERLLQSNGVDVSSFSIGCVRVFLSRGTVYNGS